jgi:protein gp37
MPVGKDTGIQWTTHTFNVAWGCVEASPGCDHCYARVLAKRLGFKVWGLGADRRLMTDSYWAQPLKWDRTARRAGRRDRVFCSSMTDVFLNDSIINRERERLWPLIEATPDLDWQILTKHPERFKATLPAQLPPNVWLGVSVESNEYVWRVEALRYAPVAVHFVSAEPLLGPVDAMGLDGIEWVIAGGESGARCRPMQLTWARDLRNRCRAAGVAFFFKQVGALNPTDAMIPADLRIREYPNGI